MKTGIDDILLAPWKTGLVFAAVRLKLFTLISDHGSTVTEIAEKCGAVEEYLKPVLDACVSMELLEYEGDGFINTSFSRKYLVEESPSYIGDFLDLVNDESQKWFQLPDIIRGRTAEDTERRYIRSDFRTFIRAMNNIGNLGEAEALKNAVDMTGCSQMIDAGGGSGIYSKVLCDEYPELRSTILDVTEALEVTREMITDHIGKKIIRTRECDIFGDSFGDNIDVVLLSDVVYEKAEATLVLRNAWDCLVDNGLLVVRGYYADPGGSGLLFGALFAVKGLVDDADRRMMTISALKKTVIESGFSISRISPLTEHSFILIGNKIDKL